VTISASGGEQSSTTLWDQATWRTFRVFGFLASLMTDSGYDYQGTLAHSFAFSDMAHGTEEMGLVWA
jgi:hypothetical protein